MKRYNAREGEICVPIMDGFVVPKCIVFTTFDDGTVEAECLQLDVNNQPFLNADRDTATVLLRGHGFAIELDHRSQYEEKAASFPEMSLDCLR